VVRIARICAGLTIAIGISTCLYIVKSIHDYQGRFGVAPEGKGYLDLVILALRAMIVSSVLAALLSVVSCVRSQRPRTLPRLIEAIVFMAFAPALILLAKSVLGSWPLAFHYLLGT
jgi:hypothetical protein